MLTRLQATSGESRAEIRGNHVKRFAKKGLSQKLSIHMHIQKKEKKFDFIYLF